MQINRLFEIIYLLLDRKMITAGELAEHFEVSTRTIYRDVDTLSEVGIPIYATKGIGGGIRLTENFVLNKSVLTEDDKKSILSSLRGMNALKIDEVQPVLEKLSALFGGEQEDWIEIDFSAWNPNNPISNRFALLKEAIFTRTVIILQYSGSQGTTTQRIAEPMKLIFRGYDWYLLAWCRLRKDFRYFKLTRMDELHTSSEHFIRRKLDVSAQPQNQYTQMMITVNACISPNLEYRVRDEFEPNQYKKQSDGSFLVQFEIPNNEWLYDYLMTYGSGMKVLEPIEVKKELIERLNSAIKQYQI